MTTSRRSVDVPRTGPAPDARVRVRRWRQGLVGSALTASVALAAACGLATHTSAGASSSGDDTGSGGSSTTGGTTTRHSAHTSSGSASSDDSSSSSSSQGTQVQSGSGAPQATSQGS